MSVAYYLAAALITAAGIYTARRCRATPSPALRAFTATLFLIAAAFLLLANGTRPLIDKAIGIPCIARWAGHTLTLAAAAGLNIMLACFARRPDDEPPRKAPHVSVIAVSSAVMATLILGTPDHDDFVDVYATRGDVTAYLMIYLVSLGVTMSVTMVSGIRYTTRTTGWLRAGMKLVVTGAAFGVAYSLYKTAVVAAHHNGHTLGTESIIGPTLGLACALLLTIGTTLGSWAPSLSAAVRRAVLYQRIAPLHKALSNAFPEVQLNVDVSDRRERLDRRVVEIHDGLLRLRPWSDPLHRAATHAGMIHEHDCAAVEALVIYQALQARANGEPPAALHTDRPTWASTTDLEAEAARLARIARAFVNPPAHIAFSESTLHTR
ncbi:MAB_1171c family putative transporter [Actinomadura sp. NPDC047616]|uniref:MAB_1171c family putative transporter n=1 Tax=Actinomadura sp. NPDC047616 TaxID=3155914 RepID=UPI0034008940